jgi:hypothetical protein
MTGEHLFRDKIITEWFFQDWIGDKSHLPEAEDVFIFMKILIDVASVNGELSEQERKYIVGRAAVFGMHILLK